MAYEARHQGRPEGLAFPPSAVSHPRVPLRQYGFHVPHAARLLNCSNYDVFAPLGCLTPEPGCPNYGDSCSTFASPDGGVGWPAVFLSPAKAQETGTDLHMQLSSSNVKLTHSLFDGEYTVRPTGGCPLRAQDLFASETDCSPLQHQRQQHELQRHVHKRCWGQQRQASDFDAGQVFFRDSEADHCLERPVHYISSYGRSLLRLVLEKGRRTLQRRRKRILRPGKVTCLKNKGEDTESLPFPAGSGWLIRGHSGPEGPYHIQPLTVDRESLSFPSGSPRSSFNNSSRISDRTTVENKQARSHTSDGLPACSPLQYGTTEYICRMDCPAQSLQQQEVKRESDEMQNSSAGRDFDVEGLQPRPCQTSSTETFTKELSVASPDYYQDIHLCQPQQDPPQLPPGRRCSQTAVLSRSRQTSWQQGRVDHPCLRRGYSSHQMSFVQAPAKAASARLSSKESDAREEAAKKHGTSQKMERLCSTCSSVAASRRSQATRKHVTPGGMDRLCSMRSSAVASCIPQNEYWRSTGCGDRESLVDCGPSETTHAFVENKNLRLSDCRIFPVDDTLLRRTELYQNSRLLESRTGVGRTRADICSWRWHCVPCLRCYQDKGEIWHPQPRDSRLHDSNRRVGAVNGASTTYLSSHHLRKRSTLQASYNLAHPVSTLFWKAASSGPRSISDTPSARYRHELSPLVPTSPPRAYDNIIIPNSWILERSPYGTLLTEGDAQGQQNIQNVVLQDVPKTVTNVPHREYGRNGSSVACESELPRFVHDTAAMKWISQERLLDSIAEALTTLVQRSDSLHKEERNRKFDGIRCPSITVRDYFYRIAALCSCSCSCHLLALIYMDRLQQSVHNLFFDMLNIHRVLITSVMCAAKFYDDTFLSNAYYAMVGGVSLHEMNRLEVRFLSMINFRLTVLPEHFGAYLSRMGCIGPQRLYAYIKTHEGPGKETPTSKTELN